MNFKEILKSLRDNGHAHVAREVERRMIDDRLCGNDNIEKMYGDVITHNLFNDNLKLTPEDVILSPEFAMLRSVAGIMATYMPIIEVEL